MSSATLTTYSFTQTVTDSDIFYRRDLVRSHNEATIGDSWKLEIQTSSNRAVVTLITRKEVGCFHVKMTILDENRQSKLEIVKTGWKYVISHETFVIPVGLLDGLRNSQSHSVAISMAIMKVVKPSMADVVADWFHSASFGDFEITSADGVKFRCHKDVLVARSPLFASLINPDGRIKVQIEDFNSRVILALLRFVYLGDWGDLSDVADRLFVAAERFKLKELKSAAAAELIVNLNAVSVVSTFRLAHIYKDKLLTDGCVVYLATHIDELALVDVITEATKDL